MTKLQKTGLTLGILITSISAIAVTYLATNYKIVNVMYLKKSSITNEFSLEGSYDLNSNLFVEHDTITGSFSEMEGNLINNTTIYYKDGYGSFYAKTGEAESYGRSFSHPLDDKDLDEFLTWYDSLELYDENASYVYIKDGDSFKKIR